MKILHIINSLSSGGAENLLSESLPLMKKKGVYLEVLLLTNTNNTFLSKLQRQGIRINYTNLNNIYSPIQIIKIIPYLKKFDIVHSHLFPANYWTALAKVLSFTNVTLLTTEHSTYNKRRKYGLFKFIDRFIYSRYKNIISISPETEEKFIEWIPSLKDRITTIYNGINIDRFKNAEAIQLTNLISKKSNNTKYILMVAGFKYQKDHVTLIRATKLLPNNYEVLLIGEGELKKNIVALTYELNLQDRIHFLGFQNNVEQFYKVADVFVLPSKWEGFGLVSVEAMASGLPVIVSDIVGLKNVVGDAGLFFPVGDYEKLAQLIITLLTSKKLYNDLKIRGINRAKEFSIEKMVDSYFELYKKIYDQIMAQHQR